MSLSSFDGLLAAARQQAEPQRLLLVFARAELTPDANAQDRERHAEGGYGALVPLVCVDKRPEEIASFAALREEAREAIDRWDIVFVAALDGRGGIAPNPDEAVQPLQMMVEQIRGGRIANFLAADHDGQLVQLQPA